MLENKPEKSKPLPPLKNLDLAIFRDATTSPGTHGADAARKAFRQEANRLDNSIFQTALKYGYDPSLTGMGEDDPVMSEDNWITYALSLMNKEGPNLYLRSMLSTLRKKLGGTPMLSAANKNDPCPCGSTKKFKNCCGKLVEDGDPTSCRAGAHSFGHWGKVKDSVWVRTCADCSAVETVDQVLEIGCEGEVVAVIPCQICKAPADHDAGWNLYSEIKKRSCIACKKVPRIEILIIEHKKNEKHSTTWDKSLIKYLDPAWTIGLPGFIGDFLIHTACLKEHGITVNEKI
jgi:hypothetical protein